MAGEEIFRARLIGSAPLVSIVGAAIHGGRVPQGTMAPFVQYIRVASIDAHVLDGLTNIRRGRFQVDCYATSYSQAVDMARAVAAAIQGQNDEALHAEVGGELDIFDDETTPKMFRRIVDFLTLERMD